MINTEIQISQSLWHKQRSSGWEWHDMMTKASGATWWQDLCFEVLPSIYMSKWSPSVHIYEQKSTSMWLCELWLYETAKPSSIGKSLTFSGNLAHCVQTVQTSFYKNHLTKYIKSRTYVCMVLFKVHHMCIYIRRCVCEAGQWGQGRARHKGYLWQRGS